MKLLKEWGLGCCALVIMGAQLFGIVLGLTLIGFAVSFVVWLLLGLIPK